MKNESCVQNMLAKNESSQKLAVGDAMFGFHIDSVVDLPDINGKMWRMTYEKNGAELVWLERLDEVKTFAIAFKTLPEDDTGVAHILEHSVLAGSEKYPVKSPFDEMRKSSLRVFMNAMTSSDMTAYPFCTRNDQDFLNLADVYLDAVFHPNVVKDPMAFLQEGWHYDINEKTGALSYNGVVYNEMKGVFADPKCIAYREARHYLYPDIVYGRDSGGKPEAIPHLTYEKFCAFYRKFYHPSNARIFLDGSIDLSSVLAKLDSYLSAFNRAEKIAPIPVQSPIRASATILYPSEECTRKTILADAWNVGMFYDYDRLSALKVLAEYLTMTTESPLKKALFSEGLCENVSLNLLPGQQRSLVMVIRNTTTEQAERCRVVVRQAIEQELKTGFDQRRLGAIINTHEFWVRSGISDFSPQGLTYFDQAMSTWLYGGDPAAPFDMTGSFKRLRAGISTGLFEKVLREAFLENTHHVTLTYVPSKTRGEELTRLQEKELIRRRKAMTNEEVLALKEELASLAEYQQRVDSKESRACVPALRVSDIPSHGQILDHTISMNGITTLIKTKSVSTGVVYVSIAFPLDGLGRDELVMVPLLENLLTGLPTSNYDVLSLQTKINEIGGCLTFSAVSLERGSYLLADFIVLERHAVEAIELIKEIITRTRFDDLKTVTTYLKQERLSAESGVVSSGDNFAGFYVARGLSRQSTARDILCGYEHLRWLQHVQADESLVRSVAALARKIFVNDGLVISMSDNIPTKAEEMLRTIVPHGNGAMRDAARLDVGEVDLAAMRIAGDTGFSAVSALLPPDVRYTGSMRVAAKILSLEYLHKEIREIGGAYGANLGISPFRFIFCSTYQDPTPMISIEKIQKAGEWLRQYAKSGPTLDRYILATMANVDAYQGHVNEAIEPELLYLYRRSVADKERERQEILSTKAADLEFVADVLQSVMPHARSFVVGGATQVASLPPSKVTTL